MRIRTIKPEFFTHDVLFEAEKETKLPLRVAFAGIWCACDRKGRFKWQPRPMGAMILPYDGVDFSRVLDALLTRGFLVKYQVGGEWYGAVPSWEKHQFINNRESESVLPDISEAQEVNDASSTRGARVGHATEGEGKGREGDREGNNSPSDKPTKRSELMDALALSTGIALIEIGEAMAKRLQSKLTVIKQSSPDVTPTEITARAAAYRLQWPEMSLTPEALAKHWTTLNGGGLSKFDQAVARSEAAMRQFRVATP